MILSYRFRTPGAGSLYPSPPDPRPGEPRGDPLAEPPGELFGPRGENCDDILDMCRLLLANLKTKKIHFRYCALLEMISLSWYYHRIKRLPDHCHSNIEDIPLFYFHHTYRQGMELLTCLCILMMWTDFWYPGHQTQIFDKTSFYHYLCRSVNKRKWKL